jgi:hypothetical protein
MTFNDLHLQLNAFCNAFIEKFPTQDWDLLALGNA